MNFVVELINGLKIGLEHEQADEEDEEDVSLVVLDVLFIRFIYVIVKNK
jgi:hypothetical protein